MTSDQNNLKKILEMLGTLSAIATFVTLYTQGSRALFITLAVGLIAYGGLTLAFARKRRRLYMPWPAAICLVGIAILIAGIFWHGHTAKDDKTPPATSSKHTTLPRNVLFDEQLTLAPGKGVDIDGGEATISDLIENETDLFIPSEGKNIYASLSHDNLYVDAGPTEPQQAVHDRCVQAPTTNTPYKSVYKMIEAQYCFITSDGHPAWFTLKAINSDTKQFVLRLRVWDK